MALNLQSLLFTLKNPSKFIEMFLESDFLIIAELSVVIFPGTISICKSNGQACKIASFLKASLAFQGLFQGDRLENVILLSGANFIENAREDNTDQEIALNPFFSASFRKINRPLPKSLFPDETVCV